MIANTKRWTYLGRAQADCQKFFRDEQDPDKRIAIADQSGTYPDQTDDGVLYVDFAGKIPWAGQRPDRGVHGTFSLPVIDPSGRRFRTLITAAERSWLLTRWPDSDGLPEEQLQATLTAIRAYWEKTKQVPSTDEYFKIVHDIVAATAMRK
jgi:hypothetical protein